MGRARGGDSCDAAERAGIGVVAAPNFALGVNLFSRHRRAGRRGVRAARRVRRLAARAASRGQEGRARRAPRSRCCRPCARRGTLRRSTSARRGPGAIPGTHTVGFDGGGETITLTHTARDRSIFARGALEAARWVDGKRGWFTMRDVVGGDWVVQGSRFRFKVRFRVHWFGSGFCGRMASIIEAGSGKRASGQRDRSMRMATGWTGCGTALVTPFARDGSIDERAVRQLARRQIDAGINFLVPCGTTGESPTLSDRRARARRRAGGRGRGGEGAGARRRRRLRHARGHRQRAADEAGRSRRHPLGHAVLQQADAGRPVPALQRDCRRGRPADRRLQRARADRLQRRGRRRWCA